MKKWISITLVILVITSTILFFSLVHFSSSIYNRSFEFDSQNIKQENDGVFFSRLGNGGFQVKVVPKGSYPDVTIMSFNDINSLESTSEKSLPDFFSSSIHFSSNLEFYLTPLNEIVASFENGTEVKSYLLDFLDISNKSYVTYSGILMTHTVENKVLLSLKVMYNIGGFRDTRIKIFIVEFRNNEFEVIASNNVNVTDFSSFGKLASAQYGNKIYYTNNIIEFDSKKGLSLYLNYSYYDFTDSQFYNVTTRVPKEVEEREAISKFRYFFLDDELHYVIIQQTENANNTAISVLSNNTRSVLYSDTLIDEPRFSYPRFFADIISFSETLSFLPFISDYKSTSASDNTFGVFLSRDKLPSAEVMKWGTELSGFEINQVEILPSMNENFVYYGVYNGEEAVVLKLIPSGSYSTLKLFDNVPLAIGIIGLEVALLAVILYRMKKTTVKFAS